MAMKNYKRNIIRKTKNSVEISIPVKLLRKINPKLNNIILFEKKEDTIHIYFRNKQNNAQTQYLLENIYNIIDVTKLTRESKTQTKYSMYFNKQTKYILGDAKQVEWNKLSTTNYELSSMSFKILNNDSA